MRPSWNLQVYDTYIHGDTHTQHTQGVFILLLASFLVAICPFFSEFYLRNDDDCEKRRPAVTFHVPMPHTSTNNTQWHTQTCLLAMKLNYTTVFSLNESNTLLN